MSTEINGSNLWQYIIDQISSRAEIFSSSSKTIFETDGDLILCNSEPAAEAVADFLEAIGYNVATTGTYDEECGQTWYYIDVE